MWSKPLIVTVLLKATVLVSRVVLFIMLCKQILTFHSVNKISVLTIQVKA